MKKSDQGEIPEEVGKIFWNLNPNNLKLDRDKNLIAMAVLSRGGTQELRWLFKTYGVEVITELVINDCEAKRILSEPDRKLWLRVLAENYLDTHIPHSAWAITRIIPENDLDTRQGMDDLAKDTGNLIRENPE